MNRLYQDGIISQDFFAGSNEDLGAKSRRDFGSGLNSLVGKGMLNHIKTECKGRESTSVEYKLQQQMAQDSELQKYAILFLKRTYWKNCYSLSKKRPNKDDAEI